MVKSLKQTEPMWENFKKRKGMAERYYFNGKFEITLKV